MTNISYAKLVCRDCRKRKKDCKCLTHKEKYSKTTFFPSENLYDWCTDIGVGEYCETCVNRFYCYTRYGYF